MSEWKPIATAPHNVELALLVPLDHDNSRSRRALGCYYAPGTIEIDDEFSDDLDEEGRNINGDWYEHCYHKEVVYQITPTHWHDMPPLPGDADE